MENSTIQWLKKRIAELRADEDMAREERQILEHTLLQVQAIGKPGVQVSKSATATETSIEIGETPPRNVGYHSVVVASILGKFGSTMRVRSIARQAFKAGNIKSANGYDGVYRIVQNTLKRNTDMFTRVGRGKWDLKERAAETKQRTRQEIEQALTQIEAQFGKGRVQSA